MIDPALFPELAALAAAVEEDAPLVARRREIEGRLEARRAAEPRPDSASPAAHAQAMIAQRVQSHSPYNDAAWVELARIDAELERRRAARAAAA